MSPIEAQLSVWHQEAVTECEKLRAQLATMTRERDEWKRKALRDPQGLSSLTWMDCYTQLSEINQQHMRERDEARAKAEKDSSYAQNAVDKICHYRNLAIILGAKPEQMLGKSDRDLCIAGIDKDDNNGGYHMSVQDALDDNADTWGAHDRMERERDEAREELDISRRANLVVLRSANEARESEEKVRAVLKEVLSSAYPHPVEHPAMTRAWAKGHAILAAPTSSSSDCSEPACTWVRNSDDSPCLVTACSAHATSDQNSVLREPVKYEDEVGKPSPTPEELRAVVAKLGREP